MNTAPDLDEATENANPRPSLLGNLHRFFIGMGLLVVLWLFLGLAPRLFITKNEVAGTNAISTDSVVAGAVQSPADEAPQVLPPLPEKETATSVPEIVESATEKAAPEPSAVPIEQATETPYKDAPPVKDAYDEKLHVLQEKIDQLQHDTNDKTNTNSRITQLESLIRKQEDTLTALKSDMEAAQRNLSRQLRASALYGQLRERALRGDAFDELMPELRSAAQGSAAALLDDIQPYAKGGVATLAELQAAYDAAITPALQSASGKTGVLATLKGLVRIRKVGNREGDDDESRIARGEFALQQGKVNEALHAVQELSAYATDIFAGWRKQAVAYVTLRNTLDKLQRVLNEPVAVSQDSSTRAAHD